MSVIPSRPSINHHERQQALSVQREIIMSNNIVKRPALGQVAGLGTLYDARTDRFLPRSLLQELPPVSAVTMTDINTFEIKLSRSDDYQDRFDKLDINPELGASFLAGLVEVEGFRLLLDRREARQRSRGARLSISHSHHNA